MPAAPLEGALERFAPGHETTAARRLIEPVRGGGVSHPERELLAGLRQAGATAWRAGVRVRVGDRNCWVDLSPSGADRCCGGKFPLSGHFPPQPER